MYAASISYLKMYQFDFLTNNLFKKGLRYSKSDYFVYEMDLYQPFQMCLIAFAVLSPDKFLATPHMVFAAFLALIFLLNYMD